jgi:2-desacetyl-2-hydroxyethyl bacteriochlorophyllide A dehydrogenase
MMSNVQTETVRAVWFPARERVEIRNEPAQAVGPDEIRVRTLCSGISQGTELLVLRGQVPSHLDLDLPTLRGSFSFPIKFGYAAVGIVTEAGSGVSDIDLGDRVFVHHPHQTEFVVSASTSFMLPASIDPSVATLLANLETAVNVVLDAAPRIGETVIVFGQGIVGILVTQILDVLGTLLVLRVEPSDERRALIAELSAGPLLASSEEATSGVMEATAGRGADLAIECSGNPDALNWAMRCLAPSGMVVIASWYGAKPAKILLGAEFHRRRLRLVSSQVGGIDPALSIRWDHRRRLEVARDLLVELDLASLITHRFPFEEAPRMYGTLLTSPQKVLQAVLTYGDEDV